MNRILTIIAAVAVIMPAIFAAEQKLTKAPDFTLQNYDGKEYNLSDYKGKIVVLEWFNYECPFARYNYEKTTAVNDFAAKYRDKNVVWLAINSTLMHHHKITKDRDFAKQFNLNHPILYDASGTVGKAYGAKTTPHIFIIDARGNIVYNGAFDNAPLGKTPKDEQYVNYIDKALGELTASKAASIAETKPYGCSVKYGK